MRAFVLFLISIAFFTSCTRKVGKMQDKFDKDNASGSLCDTTNAAISYSTDIVPILNKSCGATDNSCHSSNSTSGELLDFWAGVNYSASTGKFISSIVWDGNASTMPKNSVKLSSCEIKKIARWVNTGALDN
jgi:hypothetical protein